MNKIALRNDFEFEIEFSDRYIHVTTAEGLHVWSNNREDSFIKSKQ